MTEAYSDLDGEFLYHFLYITSEMMKIFFFQMEYNLTSLLPNKNDYKLHNIYFWKIPLISTRFIKYSSWCAFSHKG